MLVILDSGGVEVGDHMDRYLKTREAVGSGVPRRGLLWVCGYYADVTHPPSLALNVVSDALVACVHFKLDACMHYICCVASNLIMEVYASRGGDVAGVREALERNHYAMETENAEAVDLLRQIMHDRAKPAA